LKIEYFSNQISKNYSIKVADDEPDDDESVDIKEDN